MILDKDEESANEAQPLINRSSDSTKKSNTGWSKLAALMDAAILKKASFINLIIGLGLAYTASTSFSLFFPYFLQVPTETELRKRKLLSYCSFTLQRTANLSMLQAANCMSVLSTTDLLTRVTVPAFVDKMNFSHRNTFLIAGLCLVIARAIMAEMRSTTALMVTSAFYGIFRSITIVNQNLTIAEFCGERGLEAMLPNALGFNMITKGILVLSLGQVIGWFVDYSGSYALSLHAQNSLLISTCILWLCEMYLKRKN